MVPPDLAPFGAPRTNGSPCAHWGLFVPTHCAKLLERGYECFSVSMGRYDRTAVESSAYFPFAHLNFHRVIVLLTASTRRPHLVCYISSRVCEANKALFSADLPPFFPAPPSLYLALPCTCTSWHGMRCQIHVLRCDDSKAKTHHWTFILTSYHVDDTANCRNIQYLSHANHHWMLWRGYLH